MRIETKKVTNSFIDYRDDVTLTTYSPNLMEITYMKNRNTKGRIKLLPNGEYKDLTTGEIKKCKKIENRGQSKASLRRTFKRIRDAINTNCTDVRKCKMVTLTYAENMTDTKKFDKDLNLFVKNFNYRYGKSENIKVCEPQVRGAWHAHIIFIWDDIAPTIYYADVINMWGNGCVKVQNLYGRVDNLGAYFTAHLSDLPVDDAGMTYEEIIKKGLFVKEVCIDAKTGKELKQPKYYVKGARLEMYPPNFRIFRPSRGLKKPTKERMEYRKALKKVDSVEPTFELQTQVFSDDGLEMNVIIRKTYNLLRVPEENPKQLEFEFSELENLCERYDVPSSL